MTEMKKPTHEEASCTGRKLASILMLKLDNHSQAYYTLLGKKTAKELFLLVHNILKEDRRDYGHGSISENRPLL